MTLLPPLLCVALVGAIVFAAMRRAEQKRRHRLCICERCRAVRLARAITPPSKNRSIK